MYPHCRLNHLRKVSRFPVRGNYRFLAQFSLRNLFRPTPSTKALRFTQSFGFNEFHPIRDLSWRIRTWLVCIIRFFCRQETNETLMKPSDAWMGRQPAKQWEWWGELTLLNPRQIASWGKSCGVKEEKRLIFMQNEGVWGNNQRLTCQICWDNFCLFFGDYGSIFFGDSSIPSVGYSINTFFPIVGMETANFRKAPNTNAGHEILDEFCSENGGPLEKEKNYCKFLHFWRRAVSFRGW